MRLLFIGKRYDWQTALIDEFGVREDLKGGAEIVMMYRRGPSGTSGGGPGRGQAVARPTWCGGQRAVCRPGNRRPRRRPRRRRRNGRPSMPDGRNTDDLISIEREKFLNESESNRNRGQFSWEE